MRWLAIGLVLCGMSANAMAEEGLFVTRASYGASTVHPSMPDVGHMWNMSADLTLGERTGIIGGLVLVRHHEARSFAMHLGIKTLLVERFWKRIYLHLSPELIRVWGNGRDKRWDVSARAGLGYEHLLMWGFGFVVEIHGNAPLALRGGERFSAATAGVTLGLFMEF